MDFDSTALPDLRYTAFSMVTSFLLLPMLMYTHTFFKGEEEITEGLLQLTNTPLLHYTPHNVVPVLQGGEGS